MPSMPSSTTSRRIFAIAGALIVSTMLVTPYDFAAVARALASVALS